MNSYVLHSLTCTASSKWKPYSFPLNLAFSFHFITLLLFEGITKQAEGFSTVTSKCQRLTSLNIVRPSAVSDWDNRSVDPLFMLSADRYLVEFTAQDRYLCILDTPISGRGIKTPIHWPRTSFPSDGVRRIPVYYEKKTSRNLDTKFFPVNTCV